MRAFNYKPLTDPIYEIRLLHILPHDDGGQLALTLRTVSTAQYSIPAYRALSYAWGISQQTRSIRLNGALFCISPGLENALRSLRNAKVHESNGEFENMLLWIDAICINQGDIEERNQQVRKMDMIYALAKEAVIWLGDHIEPADYISDYEVIADALKYDDAPQYLTEISLNFLKYLARNRSGGQMLYGHLRGIWRPTYGDRPPFIARDDWWTAEDMVNGQFIMIAKHLHRLFHRAWFTRLWVVQEVELSPSAVVLWGSYIFDLTVLQQAADVVLDPAYNFAPPNLADHFSNLGAQRSRWVTPFATGGASSDNLLTILHSTQRLACGDPKDKLFAVLALASDRGEVQVDYSKSVEQVYQDWAVRRVSGVQNLDLLAACANSRLSNDLPTWVPELRRLFGQDFVLWDSCIRHAKAWVFETNPQPPKILGGILSVRGYRVANVTVLGDRTTISHYVYTTVSIDKASNPFYAIFKIYDWVVRQKRSTVNDMASLSGSWDATRLNQTLTRVICRKSWDSTSLQNAHRHSYTKSEQYNSPRGYFIRELQRRSFDTSSNFRLRATPKGTTQTHGDVALKEAIKPFLKELFTPTGGWDEELLEFMLDDGSRFSEWLTLHLHMCQLFCTDRGDNLGLIAGNCRMRVGDSIWLLEGALTPTVLRKAGEQYQVIGPCYMTDLVGDVMRLQPKEEHMQYISIK